MAKEKSATSHPDHSSHLKRLARVKGQIEGIERMIQEKRYCPDIITQLRAAAAALRSIESQVFKTHLSGCVQSALLEKDEKVAVRKVQEILDIVY